MGALRLLFLGDVVGAAGLDGLRRHLPELCRRADADLVVANGENVAGGLGITPTAVRELHAAGVRVVTTGNHVWNKKEILGPIGSLPGLLRPANYPPSAPGRGWCVVETDAGPVGVVNLAGRVFMDPLDCPFRTADRALEAVARSARVVLVDFHAEASSEKRALGWYLDGRATAVVGTHTHVPTADAQVLPGGTGYITDVGMTGVADSVIGVPVDRAVERFLTQIPQRLGLARGEATVCGVVVEADPADGRCRRIERVQAGPSAGR